MSKNSNLNLGHSGIIRSVYSSRCASRHYLSLSFFLFVSLLEKSDFTFTLALTRDLL